MREGEGRFVPQSASLTKRAQSSELVAMRRRNVWFAVVVSVAVGLWGPEESAQAQIGRLLSEGLGLGGEFEIPKAAVNAVLVLQGPAGAGTGFVVRRQIEGKDRFFVYTNQHVIAGAKTLPRAIRPDGSVVPLGKLVTAVNYDLAIFMLDQPEEHFLELQTEVDTQVNVGDRIATPGNSGGASTITFKFGKVVAIGPQLVEIDALIKGGNSGGPILHENGRVIGIVSYFTEEARDDPRIAGRQEIVVRRFGYRLDNVQKWEVPDWRRFVEQGERVARVEARSNDLITLVSSGLKTWNGNEEIGRIMGSFRRGLNSANSEKQALADVTRAFSQLSDMTKSDVASALADPNLYWWWKRQLLEQSQVRNALKEAFDREASEAKQMR